MICTFLTLTLTIISSATSQVPQAKQAIFNAIYDQCQGGYKAAYGCSEGLVCTFQNSDYSQCLPDSALLATLQKDCTPGHYTCARGSFCHKYSNNHGGTWALCEACRTKYSTCGSSAFQDHSNGNAPCCPHLKCTKVHAYVEGVVRFKKICLPRGAPTKRDNLNEIDDDEIERNTTRLEKRIVPNYCYNGCKAISNSKISYNKAV